MYLAMEEHMGQMTRRMEAIERRMEAMERKSKILEAAVAFNLPQPPLQEDLLLVQCSTVEEPGSTRKKEPNGI